MVGAYAYTVDLRFRKMVRITAGTALLSFFAITVAGCIESRAEDSHPFFLYDAATTEAAAPQAAVEPAPPAETGRDPASTSPPAVLFVVYVATPPDVVDTMLKVARVTKRDVVCDLGCGDGRIVVTAAKKYGVKAIGFDINPERIRESLENVRASHVEHLVTIKQADIFTLDLSEATVVTLYLLPSLNVKLMPQLEKLRPGSRIVSHDFDMHGAKPVEEHTMNVEDDRSDENVTYGPSHTLYKWVVPWEKE